MEEKYYKLLQRMKLIMDSTSSEVHNFTNRTLKFTSKSKEWTIIAEKAFAEGFYLESITININVINAYLRLAIWLESQARERRKQNFFSHNSSLEDMLMNYDNSLLGQLNDRRIYKYAKDLSIITKDELSILNNLYDERNTIFHKFFSLTEETNTIKEDLKDLSAKYTKVASTCIKSVSSQAKKCIEEIARIRKELFN